jgi:hypothetical protein
MSSDEEIIRLLTEIRDNLQEEAAWRRKVSDESVRLQQLGIRQQRIAIIVGGLVVLGGVLLVIYGMGLFGK